MGDLNLEEKTYCVYMHRNKFNDKKYIGITHHKNPKRRWLNGSSYKNSIYFYNAIQKNGWDNFDHIVLFENLSKQEAENKEIELIKEYKSNDRKFGYNISNGGESIGKHSEESKQKISRILKENGSHAGENNAMYGVKLYGEKNGFYGKHHTNATKQKARESHKDIIKPVIKYSLDGEFIKRWESVSQTLQDGHQYANVTRCCKGIYKQHHNYIWKYESDIVN